MVRITTGYAWQMEVRSRRGCLITRALMAQVSSMSVRGRVEIWCIEWSLLLTYLSTWEGRGLNIVFCKTVSGSAKLAACPAIFYYNHYL